MGQRFLQKTKIQKSAQSHVSMEVGEGCVKLRLQVLGPELDEVCFGIHDRVEQNLILVVVCSTLRKRIADMAPAKTTENG